MISIREARALPKTDSREWRNKYICVEGKHVSDLTVMGHCRHTMLNIWRVTVTPCVSEPFERNNVARAVHEKIKFDAIRAQFAEVCPSPAHSIFIHPLWRDLLNSPVSCVCSVVSAAA